MGYWENYDREQDRLREEAKAAARRSKRQRKSMTVSEVEAEIRGAWRLLLCFMAWVFVLWICRSMHGWGDVGLAMMGAFGSVGIAEIWREGDEAQSAISAGEGR